MTALARAGERRDAARTELDLALLTDGLEAEREQGITIDVAYRYFATGRRKFIIADTPGHEQYTRNMVTGASTADAAVILIDATRVVDGVLLPQTRRHSAIAKLLGIRHIAVAVNKLDQARLLTGHLRHRSSAPTATIADRLGLADVTAIPVSALYGDNVVGPSERTPWYQGPSLLEWLEQVPSALDDNQRAHAPLRFAVQYVLRGFDASEGSARGYAGRIGSGVVDARPARPGAAERRRRPGAGGRHVRRPADGRAARDSRSSCGSTASSTSRAATGWWRTTPSRSRCRPASSPPTSPGSTPSRWRCSAGSGCATARAGSRPASSRSTPCWTSRRWSGGPAEQATLGPNDIARVVVETQQPIALDPYDRIPASGSFVLADVATNHTVGAGMVRAVGGACVLAADPGRQPLDVLQTSPVRTRSEHALRADR